MMLLNGDVIILRQTNTTCLSTTDSIAASLSEEHVVLINMIIEDHKDETPAFYGILVELALTMEGGLIFKWLQTPYRTLWRN